MPATPVFIFYILLLMLLLSNVSNGKFDERMRTDQGFLSNVKRWFSSTSTSSSSSASSSNSSLLQSPATEKENEGEGEGGDALNIYILKHKREDVTGTIERRRVKRSRNLSCCPDGVPNCSDDQMMVYLAEIQAINPESIINLSTFDNLHLLCKQVSESLDKMDQFLQTCRIPPEKDLYIQLIKGVDRLYDAICEQDSRLRADFKEHFACLKQLHEDFETCFGPPDWTEDSSRRAICRAYKDIADCYYIKAAKVCGKEAAKVMKRVVRTVVDSIITVQCNFIMDPIVEDAFSSTTASHPHLPTIIMITIALYPVAAPLLRYLNK